MKKRIIPAVLALSMIFSATAFGGSRDWYVDKNVTVLSGTELTMSDAPKLKIPANSDYTEDFSFELELKNAEWLYGDSGKLAEGLTYIKFSDDWMIFKVDVSVYNPASNAIEVPLYCKITGEGDAEVNLLCTDYLINRDSTNDFATTPVSASTTISYSGSGNELSGYNDEITVLTVKENYAKSIKAGESYFLTLTNGFEFSDVGTISGTQDFGEDNIFQYLFNPDKPDRVEIRFTKDVENPSGRLIFRDMVVSSTGESDYKGTEIVVTRSDDKDYKETVKIGTFVQSISSNRPLKIENVTLSKKTIKLNGTGGPGKRVKVFMGGQDLGSVVVDSKGEWLFDARFDNELEEGLYLVETGYYSNSTQKFTSVIKTDVEIKLNKDIVTFKVGEKAVTKNGVSQNIDGKLFIDENDRMMVPLRALSNAFGIKDSNILWDDETKTVTVADYDIIEVKVGSNSITVNGSEKAMDTKAVIVDGRCYLPLRAICDALGIDDISWNDVTKTVTITNKY